MRPLKLRILGEQASLLPTTRFPATGGIFLVGVTMSSTGGTGSTKIGRQVAP